MKLILIYLLTVNAMSFTAMLADKIKAKKNLWRIPEATLLTLAAIGGSLGSYAGMHLFRHKTKHLKFSLGIPVLLAIHAVILALCLPYLQ